MTKKMFAQLCATGAIAAVTLLIGRNMHDTATVALFAVGVLATLLSAFRVHSLRARELAKRRRQDPVPKIPLPGRGPVHQARSDERTEKIGRSTETLRVTVLHPFQRLYVRGLVAALALTTPVFAQLYWLTVPDGPWLAVLLAHIVVTGLTALGAYAFFSTRITLGPDGVSERRFFGRTVLTRPGDADAILLVRLYDGNALDTLPELFVTGHGGRLLIRMRGRFWSLEDMERVAEKLDAPVTRTEKPMTRTHLRRNSPELHCWLERRLHRS
ncbi:hypothetical protein [Leifsonia xyli]|nr:hypothetical protein [Leifsonia xyli]